MSRLSGPLARATLTALLACPAAAGNYWVSPSGSDGASGSSPAAAWKTLQHAADKVHSGDTVTDLPGTYAGFILFTSGTPGAPIIFTANQGSGAPEP